jgi:hypothetical protein
MIGNSTSSLSRCAFDFLVSGRSPDKMSAMRTLRLLASGLVPLGLLLSACSKAPTSAPAESVVVIGIDGLDPAILADLIEAGRAPTFARFAKEGSLARLDTFVPTYSPVIWTTIATGQDATVHGIDDFLDPDGRPYTSNARRVPALWNLASDAGRTVDCTGWWITWPAERVNGRMVASYAAQAQAKIIWKPTLWDKMEAQTWPPELQAEIKPFLTLADEPEELHPAMQRVFPMPDTIAEDTGRLVNDLAWTLAADLSVSSVAGHLLDTGAADLSLCYLALPDVAGHRFWRYFHPEEMRYEVSPEDAAAYGDFVDSAYVEADRMLGELVAKAPAGATVIVLSDHGMHSDPVNLYDSTALTSGHHGDAPPGIIGVLGPRAAKLGNRLRDGASLGDVYQVAPMILHLAGVPVPSHWRAVQQRALPLERLLDETWRVENPLELGPNPDADFRPATPSTVPNAGSDEAFLKSFAGLGYLEGRDEEGKPIDQD